MSQGEIEQEALDNIRSAIEEVLASLLRDWQEAARGETEAGELEPERPGHRHEIKVALSA
jgi:predicted RNase H-like HicB family nuclease